MRFLVAGITILVLVGAVFAETTVSGTVSGKWDKEGSPYRVTGDLNVARGSTLWIEPEVDIIFDGPYTLLVEGKLVAGRKKQKLPLKWDWDWSKKEPVTVKFTTDLEKNPKGWGGIRFAKAGDENQLTNCEISHVRSGKDGGGIYCERAEVAVTNCTINDCATTGSGGAMAILDGGMSLTNGTVMSNRAEGTGGGIYVSGGELAVTNATIAMNEGGGIYLWHSEAAITNCDLQGNKGAAMTMLDKSEAVLTNCEIIDHTGAGIICRESEFVGTNTTIMTDSEIAAGFYDNSEAVLTNATLKGGKGLDKDESSEVVTMNVKH